METPAQEPFHDRNSRQRSRVGPDSAADIQRPENDQLLKFESYRRRPTNDSSTGNTLLRTTNVLQVRSSQTPRFGQVWIAALVATLFLELGQNIFEWYLGAFTNFNVLYGVLERSWDCSLDLFFGSYSSVRRLYRGNDA